MFGLNKLVGAADSKGVPFAVGRKSLLMIDGDTLHLQVGTKQVTKKMDHKALISFVARTGNRSAVKQMAKSVRLFYSNNEDELKEILSSAKSTLHFFSDLDGRTVITDADLSEAHRRLGDHHRMQAAIQELSYTDPDQIALVEKLQKETSEISKKLNKVSTKVLQRGVTEKTGENGKGEGKDGKQPSVPQTADANTGSAGSAS